MKNDKVIEAISKRGNGSIYLGIVGAVRTGKSTFMKRFIENLVVPNISDEYEKKRCLDEIPQSAQGKTIMTTEPKFVPSNGANVQIEEFTTNIKLIDCVGYVIPGSNGYEDESGNPRMVNTPWFSEPIPFVEAASIGTEKVIKDHSTIGIVVTTDGSIGEISRNSYVEAEQRVVKELKELNKPFVIVLNTDNPHSDNARQLAKELEDKGISSKVINARFLKPIDEELIKKEMKNCSIAVVLEDGTVKGGLNSEIERIIVQNKLKDIDFIAFAYQDEFVKHGKTEEIEKKYHIDTESIVNTILDSKKLKLRLSIKEIKNRGQKCLKMIESNIKEKKYQTK